MPHMRNTILYSLIAVFLLSSCGFEEKRGAKEFYGNVLLLNDSLNRLTNDWHTELNRANQNKSYENLINFRLRLGQFLGRNRNYIANIPINERNERLLNAEIALLENQSNLVADVYPIFEQFSSLTPKPQLDSAISKLGYDLSNQRLGIDSIKKQLDDYAKKYSFKKKGRK